MKMKQNQEAVWDAVAKKWQEFRIKPVKEAIDFIKNKKGKILDLGCGSGRNFAKTKGIIYAVDFSVEMLRHAKEYAKELEIKLRIKKAHAHNLPFKDNFFDSAIFIATLHCIETAKKREKSLKELFRILKPGAKALITVWDKDQPKFRKSKKEIKLAWRIENKKFMRYYYLYDKTEISELIKKVGFKIIKILDKDAKDSHYSKRNIILVVRKRL